MNLNAVYCKYLWYCHLVSRQLYPCIDIYVPMFQYRCWVKANLFFDMSRGRKLKALGKIAWKTRRLSMCVRQNQTVLLWTLQTLYKALQSNHWGLWRFSEIPRNCISKSQYISADVTEAHLYFLDETHFNYVLNVSNELFHNKVFLLGFMLCYQK